MSVNVNNVTDSYNAWYNYKYCGNSRGISAEEIQQIESKWSSKLSSWKAQAEKDENKYEITDDKKSEARDAGKERIKNDTDGYSGGSDKGKSKAAMVINYVHTGVASVGAALASIIAISANAAKAWSAAGAILLAASGTMIAAITAKMQAQNYNAEAADVCDELANSTYLDVQGEIAQTQADMEDASKRSQEISEDLNDRTEATNGEIEKTMAEAQTRTNSINILLQKKQSGVDLTDSEKAFLRDNAPLIEEYSAHITDITSENADYTEESFAEMEDAQEQFDAAAAKNEEATEITDFGASIDDDTIAGAEAAKEAGKAAATAGKIIGLGGAGTIAIGIAKIPKIWTTWEGTVMVACGGVAVGTGTYAALTGNKIAEQQEVYKKAAENSKEVREATQDMTAQASSNYDEKIELYDDNIALVEDLEVNNPDEMPAVNIDSSVFVDTNTDKNQNNALLAGAANRGADGTNTSASGAAGNQDGDDKKKPKV